MKVLKVRTDK